MIVNWFKPRRYKHLDMPVGEQFAHSISKSSAVRTHSWSPLIKYVKSIKRYRPKKNKTTMKNRDIMYASHRDACILSKYAFDLSQTMEAQYLAANLSNNVIGYRKLGKANYDFAADARKFALAKSSCVILCFDIEGFFDNLDHAILKSQLKRAFGVSELSEDWYKVFRHATRYTYVMRSALEANAKFSARIEAPECRMIGTLAELKAENIKLSKNATDRGIPQGTPISAIFANLYLWDLDNTMAQKCAERTALYQRYSDDIIVICDAADEAELVALLENQMAVHKLSLSADKKERAEFDASAAESIQYLGFNISPDGAFMRSSSLARQWRKLKRSIRRTERRGEAAIAAGESSKIFTSKLRRKFSPVGVRNFSQYARNSADAFQSDQIRKQVRKLERAADQAIRNLNPTSR